MSDVRNFTVSLEQGEEMSFRVTASTYGGHASRQYHVTLANNSGHGIADRTWDMPMRDLVEGYKITEVVITAITQDHPHPGGNH
ncbi:hypothetical protein ACT3SZ_10025 [Corynebacterium sp. AOP40-9SA-29]|uniref:hypothetical protein n=1 Tax=Corynebacterium sp. AOP40-9SA-29 TaxID=3457677 RepID=UPI00403319E9